MAAIVTMAEPLWVSDLRLAPKQSEGVRKRLKTLRANESWLLVTHQVNITALTGVTPAMGEGVVVRAVGGQWRVLGRLVL